MGAKMKVSRSISPKDKSKIKTTISKDVSIRIGENKIKSVTRTKSVSHNKKDK